MGNTRPDFNPEMIAFELSEICLTTFNTFDPARDAASLHIEEARKKVRKLTQWLTNKQIAGVAHEFVAGMEGVRMLTSDEDYEVIATVIALILQAFPHLMLAIELADIRPSGNA